MLRYISPDSSIWNFYFDFLNSSNGLTGFFNTLIIETTTYCNRKCTYCPNALNDRGEQSNEKVLDENLFKKIIDELASLGFAGKILPHLYGEPLLDKRLVNLVRYTKQKLPRSLVVIHTNGDFLTEESACDFENAGTDAMIITEHGNYPNNEIKRLIDSRENKIVYKYRPSEDLILMNRGGSVPLKNYQKFVKCFYPSQALAVDAEGKVILCCNDYHGEYQFGDLSTESLVDIWNKENFKKVRKETKKGNFNLDICKKCTGQQI